MYHLHPQRIIDLEAAAALAAAHIADVTTNPHAVDLGNLGPGTFVELDTKVTDKTLVSSGDIVNADINAGAAIDESKLNLNFSTHDNTNDPSADQKDALAGTDGTPSAANPYVTDSDPRIGTSNITRVLGSISAVDMFSSSTPLLVTVSSGKSLVVTQLIFKVATSPTSVATTPSAGVEVGSGTGLYDVISDEALTGLGTGASPQGFIVSTNGGILRIGASGEDIHLNLTGGSGVGTFTCDVDLIGYEY